MKVSFQIQKSDIRDLPVTLMVFVSIHVPLDLVSMTDPFKLAFGRILLCKENIATNLSQ